MHEARRVGRMLLPLALVVAWSRVYLGVHWPKDMAGALLMSAAMALLVQSPAVRAACAPASGGGKHVPPHAGGTDRTGLAAPLMTAG